MSKIVFNCNFNQESMKGEIEKVESMNNIMATDKYHLKLRAKTKTEIVDGVQYVKINYGYKCTK